MKLLNPSAWWAFGGLALLLLSLLFRTKPVQRTISNMYIWRLSEKYLKKQTPIRQMKKTILLLLQILLLAIGAFLVLRPMVDVSGKSVDFYAVLDASASMQITGTDDTTRFSKAQELLKKDIRDLPFGSTITIVTSDAPGTFLSRRTSNKQEALHAVDMAACGWSDANLTQMTEKAQEYVWRYPNSQVNLYTDHDYPLASGIQIRRIADDHAWNTAVGSLTFSNTDGAVFTHTAVSWGQDSDVMLGLYIDDVLKAAQTVHLTDGQEQIVKWPVDGLKRFRSARVTAAVTDGLTADNVCYCFNEAENSKNVLLVSKHPFYWKQILKVFPEIRLAVVERPSEDLVLEGYDLYVFDGWSPKTLPKDGSIWIADPQPSYDQRGVTVRKVLRGTKVNINYALENNELASVLAPVSCQDVYLLKFREIEEDGFYTTLLKCGELPVVLAGKDENNLRRVMFAFDLHDTNLPMLSDFVFLINGLLDYTLPDMIEKNMWQVGETVEVTMLPLCSTAYLKRPDQSVIQLEMEDNAVSYRITEPGVYTLIQQRFPEEDTGAKFVEFAAAVPTEESCTAMENGETLIEIVHPEMDESQLQSTKQEHMLDIKQLLAIVLIILAMMEWVVYSREQI